MTLTSSGDIGWGNHLFVIGSTLAEIHEVTHQQVSDEKAKVWTARQKSAYS